MAAATRRDLYLSVDGGVTPSLTSSMKAGRTALLEIGTAADQVAAEVEKAFANLADGGAAAAAKRMERSFDDTFAAIRRNAAAVAAAPTGEAALQILDAGGAARSAAAAETQALALRRTADAAANVAMRAGETGNAERVLAVSFEVAAQAAEKQAIAMRAQATMLETVAAEVRVTSASEIAANDRVAGSHARMGASGMIAEHVVRSFTDSIAAGQSPIRALTMEMGRITEAMTLYAATTNNTTGFMGKFASFMGGPWGIAVSIGAAVLVPLISEIMEMGDATEKGVEKLKKDAEQTDIARIAHAIFARTLEGEIDAQRRLNDEIERGLRTQRQTNELKVVQSKDTLADFEKRRPGLAADLAAKEADAKAAANIADHPNIAGGESAPAIAASAAAAAEEKVKEARKKLAALDADIARTRTDIGAAQAPLIQEDVSAKYDKNAAAALRYTIALGRLNAQLGIGAGQSKTVRVYGANGRLAAENLTGIGTAEYSRQLEIITKQRNDAQKAARSRSDPNRQFGRDVTSQEAAGIVRGIGGQVNSSNRSFGQQQALYDQWVAAGKPSDNPVARPGTSAHERGNALDVQMAAGMSIGKLKEAFAAQGVALTKAIVERGHYHIEWGKKGPSQETEDRQAQALADKMTRTDAAFADMKSRAQEESLQLLRSQVTDIGQAGSLDRDRIEEERKRLNAAAQARADEAKSYDKNAQARADEIKTLNDNNAALKAQASIRKQISDALAQQLNDDQAKLGSHIALLQLQGDGLTSPKDRRANAMAILSDEEQKQRNAANELIWSPDGDPRKIAEGQRQNAEIDAQHPYKVADIDRQTADPVETLRQHLKEGVGDMNDALKGVEADGLKGLEDGLVGIISGTESVAGAFKKMAASIVADIARIAVEKLILSFIPGLKDGGNVGSVLKLAAGGAVFGAGGPRDDRVPAMLSAGEYVINADAYAKNPHLVHAINSGQVHAFADGGPVSPGKAYMRQLPSAASLTRAASAASQVIYVAVDKSELFDVHVQRAAAPLAQAAMIGGSQMAQDEMAGRQFQQIP